MKKTPRCPALVYFRVGEKFRACNELMEKIGGKKVGVYVCTSTNHILPPILHRRE